MSVTASLPAEMSMLSPAPPGRKEEAATASSRAPLWATTERPPARRSKRGRNVISQWRVTSMYPTPLGPTTGKLPRAAAARRRSCRSWPSPPTSAKPEAMTTMPPTPRSAASSASDAVPAADMRLKTVSTGRPMSVRLG